MAYSDEDDDVEEEDGDSDGDQVWVTEEELKREKRRSRDLAHIWGRGGVCSCDPGPTGRAGTFGWVVGYKTFGVERHVATGDVTLHSLDAPNLEARLGHAVTYPGRVGGRGFPVAGCPYQARGLPVNRSSVAMPPRPRRVEWRAGHGEWGGEEARSLRAVARLPRVVVKVLACGELEAKTNVGVVRWFSKIRPVQIMDVDVEGVGARIASHAAWAAPAFP